MGIGVQREPDTSAQFTEKRSAPRWSLLRVRRSLKSAYNTVRRDCLYRALVARNIMNPDEVRFLQALHDSLHFVDGNGERVYLRDGVH